LARASSASSLGLGGDRGHAQPRVDVMPLLAGLGIGGLAVALAAQTTLANFIGSVAQPSASATAERQRREQRVLPARRTAYAHRHCGENR
jgi:hypothetical protein